MSLPQILSAVRRKNKDLYVVLIGDIEIPFRLPSIKQAQQYAYLLSIIVEEPLRLLLFEQVFRDLVEDDWIKESEDLPAGVPESLTNLALYFSGVSQQEGTSGYIDDIIDKNREVRDSFINFACRVICSTFHAYTFEKLEELPFDSVMKIFVQAERSLLESGKIEKEFAFKSPGDDAKAKTNTVTNQILEEARALKDFEKPKTIDPRFEELRRKAIEKAQEEDFNYRASLRGK
jgi:hypothetical protein